MILRDDVLLAGRTAWQGSSGGLEAVPGLRVIQVVINFLLGVVLTFRASLSRRRCQAATNGYTHEINKAISATTASAESICQ